MVYLYSTLLAIVCIVLINRRNKEVEAQFAELTAKLNTLETAVADAKKRTDDKDAAQDAEIAALKNNLPVDLAPVIAQVDAAIASVNAISPVA